MDSLKRGRYDFFLIICSELILTVYAVKKAVFYRNPRPVLGIFIGRNAIAYCDSTLNGVLIRTGLLTEHPYRLLIRVQIRAFGKVPFESYGGKTDLGSFVIYNADYQCFYKK